MSDSPHRSWETVTKDDLRILAEIALDRFGTLFASDARSSIYAGRLRLLCLCQGAAQHFVHGDRGVQDFDVWGFFETHPDMKFPPRWRGKVDSGDRLKRFGVHPEEKGYAGRRVDVIGRSLELGSAPVKALQAYFEGGETDSAVLLSERPIIVIYPESLRGEMIWQGKPDQGWKGARP